ncbi:hypothetical protein [Nesterenkonia halobia]|uniref:Glycoside hydrolase family 65 n=1 Tax=Nesterenkonia halobia TaxID=37922 RepID=A0ABP6RHU6_9MICC
MPSSRPSDRPDERPGDQPIDRRALVDRHRIRRDAVDPRAPLQIGNGEFALTVDATGLQTFPESHPAAGRDPADPGSLLGTQSQWGWHSTPRDPEPGVEEAVRTYTTPRGELPYVDLSGRTSTTGPDGGTAEELWLRGNPHRLMLGWIGLAPRTAGRTAWGPEDLQVHEQVHDLWTGIISSEVTLAGVRLSLRTAVHPHRDAVAVEITSAGAEPPTLALRFPHGSEAWGNAARWVEEGHTTRLQGREDDLRIRRILDATQYTVTPRSDGALVAEQPAAHCVTLHPAAHEPGDTWRLALTFDDGDGGGAGEVGAGAARPGAASPAPVPAPAEVFAASARGWEEFWSSGGVVDLSESTDPRAAELERRIVLSQQLTAINCAGSTPPQETGLMVNSWRGKFHLEMHWWHAAHFPVWGRPELLARSMRWYREILPQARATAAAQHARGARWPKQVGPEGRESPSDIGPFLIWQQPHPIHLAELLRRAGQPGVVEELGEIVEATAEFMVDHLAPDGADHALSPPLIPAQECYGDVKTELTDPTFELASWWWTLRLAEEWRERRGAAPSEELRRARERLPAPAERDGVYAAVRHPVLDRREDHPSVLGALGVTPSTPLIDPSTMARTLDDVLADWQWETTWGWDFPMVAMTATRVGRPDLAVEALLRDAEKNTMLSTGHAWQAEGLPTYLPANGGLLIAVALMAAGWDGSADAPGFPDGFVVRHEGIAPLPE